MSTAHFLVTGCARSGTGYIATVLSALDVPCGHERVFCPTRLEGKQEILWPDDWIGESSWLGAPFAAALPEDVPIFHQVREPVSFVRSKLRTRFFETPSWYKSFAEQVRPQLLEGTPVERCMRYWLEWNGMIADLGEEAGSERAFQRYRLESIDAEQILAMLEVIGIERTREQVDEALERLPRDYNTRGNRKGDQLGWSDLPAGKLRDEVRAMASAYGYGAETAAGTLEIVPAR